MDVMETTHTLDLERVPKGLAGHDVPWIIQARQAAFARFAIQGFPTRRDEEWKYTDVSVLKRRASLAPDHIPPDPSSEAALHAWSLAQEDTHLMVFVNGHFARELSSIGVLPEGVRLESLARLLDEGSELPRPFFEGSEHTVFGALNNAFATDGAVISLAPGTELEGAIYLLFISSGPGVATYPRNIVLAGGGSRATIIEHYMGTFNSHHFTDAVTQLDVGAAADIRHYKLLQEGAGTVHIAGIHAEQQADSRFASHSFALGGHLGRNDITSRLLDKGCHCAMNGLYLLDDKQHMDHHTRVDHLAPDGTSRESYRGILDGASRGVFNGKVIVHPHAVRTDAQQSNHNLLLSRQAEVDTKPQLEILADDVKCAHGATVGQLDEAALFYLCSRGIDADLAKSMLVYGFANDIIEKVENPVLRTRIEHLVLDRLPQGDSIKELM
jgi:Fe-S cluster assembly protein SufD